MEVYGVGNLICVGLLVLAGEKAYLKLDWLGI